MCTLLKVKKYMEKDCSQKVISSVCHSLDKYIVFSVHTNNEILEILARSA